jgi:hypothetical protein
MMSRSFEDDARFDRLVDGELSADEYRALVASLDDEPSGWRRCALAFLESQALAGELAGVRRGMTLGDDRGNTPAPASVGKGNTEPRRGPAFFRLTTFLAIAASFLLAFGLGIAAPRWFGGASGPTVAENTHGSPAENSVATNAGNPPRHESFKPIGNVQLVVDGPGGDSTAVGDVPIYDLPGSVEQWLANERPSLSPEVLQTLQDRGHRVERQVEYVPVLLNDGRQVIVPLERYQIRPANDVQY